MRLGVSEVILILTRKCVWMLTAQLIRFDYLQIVAEQSCNKNVKMTQWKVNYNT